MKKFFYKLTAIIIAVIMLLPIGLQVFGEENDPIPETNPFGVAEGSLNLNCKSAILMDADSGKVLFEKNADGKFFYFSTKATKIYSEVEYPDNCYLVFGKETAGLPEDLLFANADKCVRIPMIDEARSLNLSNAVAIGVYETLRQWDYPQLLESGELRDYLWSDQQ